LLGSIQGIQNLSFCGASVNLLFIKLPGTKKL
jgi:hypothetical protein